MAKTIGQQLKQAREAKNLTILKVAQATHIRAYQIEAIEAEDFESLPSPVQARAYLRLYAEFLGFSVDEMVARQRAGVDQPPAAPSEPTDVLALAPEPAPADIIIVENKPGGFFTSKKRVILRPKVAFMPMEPVEGNNLMEPLETDTQELASPPEHTPALAPEALRSQSIFNAIGNTLRQQRESLSMTLDEIERHTHVGKHYLQALEAGEFDRLPSSVQARGMLNNYAHFLDLDEDALLLTFAEGLQTQRLERQSRPDENFEKTASKSKFITNLLLKFKIPSAIRRYFSVDIFVGGGLVIVLLIFAIWGTSNIINLRTGSTPQPTALSISNILISTPEVVTDSPTLTTTGNGSSTIVPVAGETIVLTLPPVGQGAVQVVVVALEQAWVRVTVDGKVKFEGRVTAGTAYPFDGNSQIEVLTGNGRAISILYNQNNLGAMGDLDEVVDHIYTSNAILNPTATFTPTPTITPSPTITLRPSATLRPSTTLSPSTTPRITATPSH